MSTVLIEHNRRAVYSALVAICKERRLLEQAFGYWEAHFSSQGTFRVSQYIDALVNHVGLSQEQRRELSVGLYSALGKADSELAVVPTVLRRGNAPGNAANLDSTQRLDTARAATLPATPSTAANIPARSAGAAVLAGLLIQLIDGAARAKQLDELSAAVNFPEADLSQPVMRAANQWHRGGFKETVPFANQVGEAERSRVVNIVYIALCEAVGPANADRILGQAVLHAEKLPEAIEFSPKQLL
jgi:hypothetical protein